MTAVPEHLPFSCGYNLARYATMASDENFLPQKDSSRNATSKDENHCDLLSSYWYCLPESSKKSSFFYVCTPAKVMGREIQFPRDVMICVSWKSTKITFWWRGETGPLPRCIILSHMLIISPKRSNAIWNIQMIRTTPQCQLGGYVNGRQKSDHSPFKHTPVGHDGQ